ncbi:MAG: GvpL/GvpF family gas vesicle protein [Pseudomonadota bacterium]
MTEQSPETDTNMIWTIHGIIRRETFPPSASPPHRTIDVGELTALVSARPAPPMPDQPDLEAEAEFVLFHNKLLVSYAATSDVVPVRYGAYLMSKADVKIRVAEQVHVHQKIQPHLCAQHDAPVQKPVEHIHKGGSCSLFQRVIANESCIEVTAHRALRTGASCCAQRCG